MTSDDRVGGDQAVTTPEVKWAASPGGEANRGDNAANDQLVEALVGRIRAQRASSAGGR